MICCICNQNINITLVNWNNELNHEAHHCAVHVNILARIAEGCKVFYYDVKPERIKINACLSRNTYSAVLL